MKPTGPFIEELTVLINKHNAEAASDTPDFILAHHMAGSLEQLASTVRWRESWYGRGPSPVAQPTEVEEKTPVEAFTDPRTGANQKGSLVKGMDRRVADIIDDLLRLAVGVRGEDAPDPAIVLPAARLAVKVLRGET